jgi:hypothetical protein
MPYRLPAFLLLALLVGCGHREGSDPGPSAPVVEFVTRQETLTPLPLRVSLPARLRVERVVVFVRTWGTRHWSVVELARAGQTWGGQVSCREVSTVTGDTKYFFLALDSEDEPVIGSGSPDWPHVATIVGALPDGAQGLPGEDKPLRCHDPADCPPDFPGCPAYAFRRTACRTNRDCREGLACAWDGYCGSPTGIDADADPTLDEEQLLARAIEKVTKRRRVATGGTGGRP